MKINQFKNLIKEEIAFVKLEMLTENISNIHSEIKTQTILKESILANMISLFLGSKFKTEAEALSNSPEYKELIGQMEISSKTLNRLADKLKDKVQDYQKNIKSMQTAGLKVKLGQTPEQMSAAFDKWQRDKNKAIDKQRITKINPEWQKFLR
jgi:vancomycin resistance protein YoaR